jgi:hypothetical protein
MITAADNSLRAMRDILTDPELCGWPRDRVMLFPDPENGGRFAQQLRRIAEHTTGVLLFYFVGHGTITRRGDLCLTLTDTEADGAEYTGLEYSKIKDILIDSPAQIKVSILDCCYSGRAIEALSSAEEQVADTTDIRGVYTLTAADHTAHVVPLEVQGEACTSFTAEFVSLLGSGMTDGPPVLNLNLIYGQLLGRLVAQNLPRPNQRGTDTADRYPFAKNAALSGPRTGRSFTQVRSARPSIHEGGSGARTEPTRSPVTRYHQAPAEVPNLSWPDPESVRSFKDYTTTLHRTWIRAGAPTGEEIERRTGGLVKSYKAQALLQESNSWDASDLQASLLLLEAYGISEDLIKKWNAVGSKMLKLAPGLKRKEEIAEKRRGRQSNYSGKNWHLKYAAILPVCVAIYCIAASAIAQMPTHAVFGGGNWLAFSISVIILGIGSLWWLIGVIPYSWHFYSIGRTVAITAALLSCGAAFTLGWFFLQRFNGVVAMDHHVWYGLGWRF